MEIWRKRIRSSLHNGFCRGPEELPGGLAARQATGQDLRERDAQEARQAPRLAATVLRPSAAGTLDQVSKSTEI